MPFRKSPSMDRTGVERIAEGWGKVVARRVHEEVGPDLDLDADDIEQMAAVAARAVARGTIADLLERKASLLGTEQPCPTCRRSCVVRRQPRTIDFWGGPVTYAEQVPLPGLPPGFFQPGVAADAHDCSPSVLRKIVRSAARGPPSARRPRRGRAEVTISGRQLTPSPARSVSSCGPTAMAGEPAAPGAAASRDSRPWRSSRSTAAGSRSGRGRGARGPRGGLAGTRSRSGHDGHAVSDRDPEPGCRLLPRPGLRRRSSGPSVGGRTVGPPGRAGARRGPVRCGGWPSRGASRNSRCTCSHDRLRRAVRAWSPPRRYGAQLPEAAAQAFLGTARLDLGAAAAAFPDLRGVDYLTPGPPTAARP
jgi:hypothetical protein